MVRNIKKIGALPDGGIIIYFRKGLYIFSKSFILDTEDAGTKESPIRWQSYQNEKVIFSGGLAVSDFEPIKDKEVLKRIDKKFQNKILMLDLKKSGIIDYGAITPRASCGLELFFNNKRMTLARYPNEGWLKISDVPQLGEKLFNRGLDREKRFDGIPAGRHYGKIKFDTDRPNRWKNSDNIYCHGYWTFDWSDAYQKVKSIDLDLKEITFEEPHHHYGYTKNQRYCFLNILEELDTPGEWFLDRKNGILYFWPPSKITKNNTVISLLEDPLVSVKQLEYLTIQGITFENSRGTAIAVYGGKNNLISDCIFRNLGQNAVVIEDGNENGIRDCDIYDIALGGIILNGGDRKTLTPGGSYAINNHIHKYSQWIRSGQLAIRLGGVGNRVANNLINDAPHEGIYLTGNDQIVEYNEIYNVCNETGDAGAIHTGRNYTWRGNIIRYNYFHHLKGPGLHGVVAIYLDDFASGFNVYGNICYKAGRGTLIGGGRDNTIENNVYIDCHPSIILDARGLGWASNYFDGTIPTLWETMNEMNYDKPPYSIKYPELINLLNDTPAIPKNNKIIHNISYGGRWIELLDFFAYDFSVVTIKNNLIADPEILKRYKEPLKGWEPYYLNLDVQDGYIVFKNSDYKAVNELKDNTFINKDPGFVDLKNENFQLRDNSPAFKIGFKNIPIEKIGINIINTHNK
jgi:hypothetical protein